MKLNTTTAILADVPDPTQPGASYTVAIAVTPGGPGPAPTGTVTVTDGAGASCTINLPANSCNLVSSTPGLRTLTATYSGDAFYKPSSGQTQHTVLGQAATPTPTPIAQANCAIAPGCEGDVNRSAAANGLAPGLPGPGDGKLDGDDFTWYDLFANGQYCPATGVYPFNEFQRMDTSPRLPGSGNGSLDVDRSQLERYVAGLDPRTAAGGPILPIVSFCTATGMFEGASKAAPSDPNAIRMLRIPSVMAKPGTQIEVPIEADLAGGEVTAQFTIHIDPAVLGISSLAGANVNPDVILGEGSPEGTRVIVNTSELGNGDIGIILNFNGSGSYPAVTAESGAKTLVVLRFRISDDVAPGSASPISFNDGIFVCKLSDRFARALDIGGGLRGGAVIFSDGKRRR